MRKGVPRVLKVGLAGVLISGAVFAGDLLIRGKVIDDNNTPVPAARVTLTARDATEPLRLQTQSDPTGRFSFSARQAPGYWIQVESEGHFLVRQPITLEQSAGDLAVVLPRQMRSTQSIDVVYSGASVDAERTHTQTVITGSELVDVPYPKTNDFRNAIRILPGTVKDSRGGIHINGGGEEQTLYTLDGFTLNDPLSGMLEARLSVEAVRAFELKSGSLPAEYGKGAAGTLAIRTETGSDRRRFTATNFVPGFERQKEWMVGGWTPRLGFSTPIRRGKAWVSDSMDVQFTNTVVREAQPGNDRSTSWRGGNMLRAQVNLTPSHILHTGLLSNYLNARNSGLTALDPIETTADRRALSNFFHIKDQIASAGGGLAEFGYAAFRSVGRESPHGGAPQIFTPYGRRGNYLMDARRTAARDEYLVNVFVPGFSFGGRHQIKAGFDGDSLSYDQDVHRNGIEFRRADWSLTRKTLFAGSGAFRNRSTEVSAYLQDAWKPLPSVVLEIGARVDWDSLVGRAAVAPRVGLAKALSHATKLAGGYAVVYEAASLRLFSEALDQYSISTMYDPEDPAHRIVSITRYHVDPARLKSPRYNTWNAAVEHEFQERLYARASYLRRRGSRGFAFLPEGAERHGEPDTVRITQTLSNMRTDIYDAVEVLVRHTFRTQYEWMAAYTRSRALSNAVTDIRIDNPIVALHNAGRMPWDSPNRVLSWGYLPTWSKKWAIAYMLEYRTGHPFSINDENGMVVGKVNSRRYPTFLEINTHIERRFIALGHRWAFRFGFNNITNHKNPNVVVNTIGVPDFLRFYGGQSRAFNVRMRWLGKSG